MKANYRSFEQAALAPENIGESFKEDFLSETHITANGYNNDIDAPLSDPVPKKEKQPLEIHETADNLNNLIAFVIGNISLAKMELQRGSIADKYLDEAVKACTQTKLLTGRLMKGSGK